MAYESGYTSTLTQQLTPTGTLKVVTAPTATAGRVYLNNSAQEEWISYTGVSGTELTGLTRGLSQTADPATAGTGLTRPAGTKVVLVAMHDQLFDRQSPEATTFATTAARDSALGADGAATKSYANIYVTATGLFYNYNLSSGQWEDIDTGTTTPNASVTVAGKKEDPTDAQSVAGTDVGETGATMSPTCSQVAANIQSGTFISGTAAAADTKTMTLTPTLTAYAKGIYVVTNTTVNTGAVTLNIDGLGAKAVQTLEGGALIAGDMANTTTYILYYDGTQFKLCATVPANATRKGIAEMCTDAEAIAGVDEIRYVNSKQIKSELDIVVATRDITAASGTITYAHTLGKIPKYILVEASTPGGTSCNGVSYGAWDGTNNKCSYIENATTTTGTSTSYSIRLTGNGASFVQTGVIGNATTTDFDVVWTIAGAAGSGTGILTFKLIF